MNAASKDSTDDHGMATAPERSLRIALVLTGTFLIAEVIGGIATNSLALQGTLAPTGGTISRPKDLIISTLPQETGSVSGTPFELAGREELETDYFLTLLRKFGFPRESFTRDAREFSMGQQKKLLLAASMAKPAHLYLWDEPLNYIDLESREQIEDMLKDTDATLVFVEHDRHFVEKIATDIIDMS